MGSKLHRTMCPMNCHPTYCGMVVEIDDDRVAGVRGDRENPDSRGFLCVRGRASAEIVDNPRRLLSPRLRDRRRGEAWRDVSWDAALDRISGAFAAAGPGRSAVWLGHGLNVNAIGRPIAERFSHLVGAQWWQPAIVCWGLGGLGFALTGVTEVNSMSDLADHAELILLWGANLVSQPNTAPRLVAARKRGARVVAIDVRDTEAFAQADETFRIRPGTDTALALALMHVIVGEGLYDREFTDRHTTGFAQLADHVRAYPPEWAQAETGLEAERISRLARAYASSKRSLILAGGSSMHKSGNSWQAARAISCLPALTGSLGAPGAGMGPRHGARASGMGMGSLVPPRRVDLGELEVPSEMSSILAALEGGRIRALLLLGTNLLSSFADAGRVERALAGLDLVASFDLFTNETSRHADVLLPGTSWLEETGFKATNTHLYLMDQALSPRGQARPAWWLLDQLARRLGVDDLLPAGLEGAMDAVFDHDATRHASVASMRAAEQPWVPLAVSSVAHADLRFPTPSGRVELLSGRAVALGLPALPVYEPGCESRAGAAPDPRFPLVLTTGRTINHFHAFYDHGRALPSLVRADPGPRLWISSEDADARGIADGGAVRVFNGRGEMAATARVTERVPSGVVWMRDGWEGLNRLTSCARTVPDAAAAWFPSGSAAYDARVQVVVAGNEFT
jgi:anaerobic selenocysteine-containing dehydrogenase